MVMTSGCSAGDGGIVILTTLREEHLRVAGSNLPLASVRSQHGQCHECKLLARLLIQFELRGIKTEWRGRHTSKMWPAEWAELVGDRAEGVCVLQ